MYLAQRNPAYRNYLKRMAGAAIAYVAAIFAAVTLLRDHHLAEASAIAIALVPGLAVLAMIWAIGRLLVELDDEFLRLLEIRKALVATGLTLAIASVWGLLEMLADVPRLPVFWIFPIWSVGLGIGALVNRATIGESGCA